MSEDQISRFYKNAMADQALMREIQVKIPARPHDGLEIDLSSCLSTWESVGVSWMAQQDAMGGFIEFTRAKMAYDFLHESTQKYLLMIDTDTAPCIDLPWLLVRHEAPVVGSCIVSMSPEGRRMLCFSRADTSGIPRFIDFDDGDKIPATGLAEVPHCGTGAMMIRRDVLESFSWDKKDGIWDIPFFVPDDVMARGLRSGKLIEGEDIRFCKQAKEKGIPVQVDMEAHCGHTKPMRLLFPPQLRDPSLDVKDWIAPQKGMALTNG